MRGILFAISLGIFSSMAHAVSFSLDPWIIILEPSKNTLSQVITLKYVGDETRTTDQSSPANQGTAPIPIEITVLPRLVDENGSVRYTSQTPSPEFVVFPSQLILYPGDEQKVQLQWVAEKIPKKEVTFGLIAAQQPVAIEETGNKFSKARGQINILTRYESIIVMRPEGVKPKIVVDSVYPIKDSTGENQMMLLLSNQGTGMQSASEMKLEVAPIGKNGLADFTKKILYAPNLPHSQVKNAIFADGKRRLLLPWPEHIPVGPIQVTPEFP